MMLLIPALVLVACLVALYGPPYLDYRAYKRQQTALMQRQAALVVKFHEQKRAQARVQEEDLQ